MGGWVGGVGGVGCQEGSGEHTRCLHSGQEGTRGCTKIALLYFHIKMLIRRDHPQTPLPSPQIWPRRPMGYQIAFSGIFISRC